MSNRQHGGRGKPSPSITDKAAQADATAAMPEDFGNALGQHLRREPALILTAVSLAAAACGLWASYWYYNGFGIQIIDYMQVGDFLIGWLRDPVYIGLVLLAIALGWLVTWKDRFAAYHPQRARALRSRHLWARLLFREGDLQRGAFDPLGPVTGMLVGILLFALALIVWYDWRLVERIKAGDGQRIQITRTGNASPDAQAPILLGVLSNWVFVYWVERGNAEAIPQGALTRLSYPKQDAAGTHASATPFVQGAHAAAATPRSSR